MIRGIFGSSSDETRSLIWCGPTAPQLVYAYNYEEMKMVAGGEFGISEEVTLKPGDVW